MSDGYKSDFYSQLEIVINVSAYFSTQFKVNERIKLLLATKFAKYLAINHEETFLATKTAFNFSGP